jgi:predicted transcriptional regulator
MTVALVREQARKLVDALPDDATWDDLMYEIYVRQSVEEGLADADAGRVTSVEDLRESFGLPR